MELIKGTDLRGGGVLSEEYNKEGKNTILLFPLLFNVQNYLKNNK